MSLTIKQKNFCDDYIITGNATESYLKFYKSVKNKETARANSSRLLSSEKAKNYIKERMEILDSEKIAEQKEILKYLTSIMRGEEKEETLIGQGMGEQAIAKIDVSAKDRIKAAELLGKRYAMWTDKVDVTEPISITIRRKDND